MIRDPRKGGKGVDGVLWVCLLSSILILAVAVASPLALKYLFFQMPGSTTEFDCDDSALLMLDRISRLGIAATPMLGNLKRTGETYLDSDHVWLLVDFRGISLALDWGTPRFDRQYYEGYPLTRSELVAFVEQDQPTRTAGWQVAQPESAASPQAEAP